MTIRINLMGAVLGAGIAFLPGYANAVVGAYLGEKGFSEQTQNAADSLESALAAAATKGESVRGASGALGSIVTNSGSLICEVWIAKFKNDLKPLYQEAALNPDLDPLIQKAEDFIAKLEANCTRVGLIGQTPTPGGGGGGRNGGGTSGGGGNGGGTSGGGGIGGGPPGRGGVTDGPGAFTPTPGSSIADEICRRNCADKKEAMDKAVREYERMDGIAKRAEDDARKAEAAVSDAEAKRASLKSELASVEQNPPTAGTPLSQQVAWNNTRNSLRASLKSLSDALPGLKKTAAEERRIANNLSARAKELKAEADAATAAYNECMRIWRSKANAACPPTNALQVPADGAPGAGTSPPVKSSGNQNNQTNSTPTLPGNNGGTQRSVFSQPNQTNVPAAPQQNIRIPRFSGSQPQATSGLPMSSRGDVSDMITRLGSATSRIQLPDLAGTNSATRTMSTPATVVTPDAVMPIVNPTSTSFGKTDRSIPLQPVSQPGANGSSVTVGAPVAISTPKPTVGTSAMVKPNPSISLQSTFQPRAIGNLVMSGDPVTIPTSKTIARTGATSGDNQQLQSIGRASATDRGTTGLSGPLAGDNLSTH